MVSPDGITGLIQSPAQGVQATLCLHVQLVVMAIGVNDFLDSSDYPAMDAWTQVYLGTIDAVRQTSSDWRQTTSGSFAYRNACRSNVPASSNIWMLVQAFSVLMLCVQSVCHIVCCHKLH